MSSKQRRWHTVDKSSIKIEILIERYLSACRSAGMSPKTLRGYNEKLQRYLRMVGGCLGDFTLDTVREHLINLQDSTKWEGHPFIAKRTEKLSPTSVRNHGMVLTGFSKWLFEEGYTETKVLAKLKLPRADKVTIEPLSNEEISRLVNCFDIDTEIGCRNAAGTWLFLDTGIRCSEEVVMDMDNLFLETRRFKISGKGRKQRILPFGHHTKRLLERYIYHLRPEPIYGNRVFLDSRGFPITENTIKMFIERAAKWADIRRLNVHLLRHTFATRFIMEGGDVSSLQELLGHQEIETTMRYVKRGALQQIVLNRAISPMDAMQLSNRTNFRRGKKIR